MKFKCGDFVKFVMSGSHLDGHITKICGVASSFPEMDQYIVEIPDAMKSEWTHMQITEHCLELTNTEKSV
jgi:hypothetical protein